MPSTYSKVYMEDFGVGVKPIEGVSTTTAGFLGVAERGPIKPRLVTNFVDFERIFGNYQENSNLAYAVEGFFKNGGQRCFVGRITAKEDGDPAFLNWSDIANTKNFTMSAIGPGEWGNRVCVKIENGSLAAKKLELFKVTFVYFPEKYGDILNDTLSNIDDNSKFTFDPTNPFNSNNKTRNDLSLIVAESYDNLSPDPKSADYYKKKINGISNLVIISDEIHTNDSSPRPLNTDTKLFQWDAVSTGSVDSKALKDFLVWNFGQELLSWIASVEPLTPDAETIEFKNDTHSVRVERNENKATVNINGKNSYEFNVKVENGKQIVYSSNIICFEKGSTKEDLRC